MSRRWIRNRLMPSAVIAVLLQLALVAVVAASTGGGDFPAWR